MDLYRAPSDFVNLDLARQSKIDPNERAHCTPCKASEKDRFRKVATGPNSQNLTERGISVSVIIVAGGQGVRMQSATPKQFLLLEGRPVIAYSIELFQNLPWTTEVIVACDQRLYDTPSIKWAPSTSFHQNLDDGLRQSSPGIEIVEDGGSITAIQPPSSTTQSRELSRNSSGKVLMKQCTGGKRRQDSVWNALQCISDTCDLVCIHDAARPLIKKEDAEAVILEAARYGAAALAVPAKNTIKEVSSEGFVEKTLDRSRLWEMQTPQVMRPSLLKEGFAIAHARDLTVTDDIALVSLTNHPVKLVRGSYSNIKLTTPEDWPLLTAYRHHDTAKI